MNKPDKLEDPIYAAPIGSTTVWRCVECNVPIAREGAPCKCTHPERFKNYRKRSK